MISFSNPGLAVGIIFIFGSMATQTIAYEFGSKVLDGDVDLNNLLYCTAPTPRYWDINSNSFYDNSDVVYLSWSNASPVKVIANDLRLSPFGNLRSGSQVKSNDGDYIKPLSDFISPPKIVYVDLNGNGMYDLNDPAYYDVIDISSTEVSHNDIRLTPLQGLAAGTKVTDYDADLGMKVKLLDSTLRFYNKNGNWIMENVVPSTFIYDIGDLLYIDISMEYQSETSPFGFVVVNDIRLSTTEPP